MWLLVSSVQMYPELLPVETAGPIDIERWVENYRAKFLHHFRERGMEP